VEQLAEVGVRADSSSSVAASRRVASRIAETALARGCDTIVLGSTRQRRFSRLFSRRLRERTTLLSLLPVLIAPSPLSRIPAGVSFHQVTEADVAQLSAAPSSS
jgi:nucleotide-binding universal stress UspA family protein